LRCALHDAAARDDAAHLSDFYGQMRYHLGWVDSSFAPIANNPGKLIRPTLLLLAYEAVGAWEEATTSTTTNDYLQRALPAAAAIELTHNFTLIHDDVEDGDAERRHRATLWSIWGIPQAINTGDGMFALARLVLWDVLDKGVEAEIAARLAALLDRTCLVLAEGQHLDTSFETRQDVSVAMYLDMIGRKTGMLIACAAEMGARLGTRDQRTIESLRHFGLAMGAAFQIRDDILGVWATTAELGKTPAGDIYRRKKSLPILHALEHADPDDQQRLYEIYQQSAAIMSEQAAEVLSIMERTQSRAYCHKFLNKQCQLAYEALKQVPRTSSSVSQRALQDLERLINFLEHTR
jgi:geranylgeranyl diphosphate synthase type I